MTYDCWEYEVDSTPEMKDPYSPASFMSEEVEDYINFMKREYLRKFDSWHQIKRKKKFDNN